MPIKSKGGKGKPKPDQPAMRGALDHRKKDQRIHNDLPKPNFNRRMQEQLDIQKCLDDASRQGNEDRQNQETQYPFDPFDPEVGEIRFNDAIRDVCDTWHPNLKIGERHTLRTPPCDDRGHG